MKPYDVLRLGDDDNFTAIGGGGSAITMDIQALASGNVSLGDSYTQVTCTVSLNSDGTISGTISGAWHDPQTAGVGSSYWALVTITSGMVTTGTTGSRVSLATGHTWTVKTTGTSNIRYKFAEGTIEIWDASVGGNMVSTGLFLLEASGIQESEGGGELPPVNER